MISREMLENSQSARRLEDDRRGVAFSWPGGSRGEMLARVRVALKFGVPAWQALRPAGKLAPEDFVLTRSLRKHGAKILLSIILCRYSR